MLFLILGILLLASVTLTFIAAWHESRRTAELAVVFWAATTLGGALTLIAHGIQQLS